MSINFLRERSLIERIRWLRHVLPPFLALVVVFYQLVVARTLHDVYGHTMHYLVEIVFYSLGGPIVTWLTLIWIERGVEEKEALEKQIQVQSEQIASLASASADAIVSLDGEGKITSWNRGASRMFGYSAAEINGRPLSRILIDTASLDNRMLQAGTTQNFEVKASTRGGRPIAVDITLTRSEEGTDEASVSLLIMRDITARREREAILEEERSRIARDLHDGVAQSLYFLALKTDMAQQQISETPEKVAADLKEMGEEARRVIREVRRTIFALNPLDWSQEGFLPALRDFVERFAEQVDWQIEVDINDNVASLPQSLEPTIFRLVQESLNNVAKHADARNVDLRLFLDAKVSEVMLRVADDGAGFSQKENGTTGFGLKQMQARVEALGGDFNIRSNAGGGTIVIAHLPLPEGDYDLN